MNDIKVGVLICVCVLCAGLSSCAADKGSGVYAQPMPSVSDTDDTDAADRPSQIVMNDVRTDAEEDTEPPAVTSYTDAGSTEVTEISLTGSESAPETTTPTTTEPVTTVPTSEPETAETTTTVPFTSVTEMPTQPQTAQAVTKALPIVTTVPANDSSLGYNKSFYESDLFIGDSISTGYSLYGYLDPANVYAKVGLNPSTVLTKNVNTVYGDIGISEMIAYTKPRRAYIMLGSNGIQWLSVKNMTESTDKLVERIKAISPDTEIVIVSVPPVTPAYDSTVADVNVMAKINEYNNTLSGYCDDNGLIFCNIADELKDSSGYFDAGYSEKDGMHFKPAAYKIVLGKIQSDVETVIAEREAEAAETELTEILPEDTETVSESEPADETTVTEMTEETVPSVETQPAETEVTSVTAETTAPVSETVVAETAASEPAETTVVVRKKKVVKTAETTKKAAETEKPAAKTSGKSADKKTSPAKKTSSDKARKETKTSDKKTVKSTGKTAKKTASSAKTTAETSVKKNEE